MPVRRCAARHRERALPLAARCCGMAAFAMNVSTANEEGKVQNSTKRWNGTFACPIWDVPTIGRVSMAYLHVDQHKDWSMRCIVPPSNPGTPNGKPSPRFRSAQSSFESRANSLGKGLDAKSVEIGERVEAVHGSPPSWSGAANWWGDHYSRNRLFGSGFARPVKARRGLVPRWLLLPRTVPGQADQMGSALRGKVRHIAWRCRCPNC